MTKPTIAAQATASGKGGVGIIRVSGDKVKTVAQALLGFIPPARQATLCQFHSDQHILDQGIALYFPAPHSFTGEDVLELQGHGGPVVLDLLLKTILEKSNVRLARPGEFSERAFLNKKIDLAQAEAIADLINADSAQAAKCAMRSLQGEFSQKIYQFRDELIDLRKFVEAAIDFPEEEIDFISEHNSQSRVEQLISAVTDVKKTAKQGVLLQEGIKVVITGEPNVGKSSLLNRLSGTDRAIVTNIAGTTRDILQEFIHIDGLTLHLIDTAGLRETGDIVEQQGVSRARQAIKTADLLLLVLDASQHQDRIAAIKHTREKLDLPEEMASITIINKMDLVTEKTGIDSPDIVGVSALCGEGLDDLKTLLKQKVGFNQQQEGVFIARRRHLQALEQTLTALRSGLAELEQHRAGELLAENLRIAQQALNEITGDFSSDDLLGEIFSNFCIGK